MSPTQCSSVGKMDPVILITCIALTGYDGDTVRCDGQLLRPMGDGAPYVSGFDAPEIGWRAKCENEHELGMRATRRMEALIKTPGLTIEDSGEVDRFDRPLVVLRLPDGRTTGQILIDDGYARIWLPNRRRHDWCLGQ